MDVCKTTGQIETGFFTADLLRNVVKVPGEGERGTCYATVRFPWLICPQKTFLFSRGKRIHK